MDKLIHPVVFDPEDPIEMTIQNIDIDVITSNHSLFLADLSLIDRSYSEINGGDPL